jgi:hypothetical protein
MLKAIQLFKCDNYIIQWIFSEKSGKNPKNEDKTISNGEVITCRISKTYYNSYGYLKP